jgi:peptidoglycan-N-acetylglucosamine deacetylase
MRTLPLRSIVAVTLATMLLTVPAFFAHAVDHRIKPVDGSRWGTTRFRGGGLIRGHCARRPCIALTFDDGPDFNTTPLILDELERHNVRATFFVTGHRIDGSGEVARKNREVLADTWRRGHMVGNHTYHHELLDTTEEPTLSRELDRTGELIEQTLGQRTYLFRAPYGALHHPRAVRAVYSRGLTPVFWEIDSRAWEARTDAELLSNVRAGLAARPRGGVILFHDTLPRTTRVLPHVFAEIERLNQARREQGQPVYEFVGLDELWQPVGAARRR